MQMNPAAVYVVAPAGRGKSRHAALLAELFGCRHVIDEWDGVAHVPDGALVLANHAGQICAKTEPGGELLDRGVNDTKGTLGEVA